MPVLNIKDPEAYSLAAEIAAKTGKSLTRVVVDALRAETQRIHVSKPIDRAALKRLQNRIAALPVIDGRAPDKLLGYDERGLP